MQDRGCGLHFELFNGAPSQQIMGDAPVNQIHRPSGGAHIFDRQRNRATNGNARHSAIGWPYGVINC